MTLRPKMRRVVAFTGVTPMLATAAFVAPLPAAAQQQAGIEQCLSIADVNRRVACYDAIARAEQAARGPAPSAASAAPSPPPASAPAPVVEQDRRAEFGLSAARREQARPAEQRQLEDVQFTVSAVRPAGAGYWQFSTTDGALWRIMENRRSFRPPRTGDDVRIRRGSLGSYYLEADNQPSIRVQRIE